MTATLLASLFTVIAASSVSAAITVAGVGTISQGATSSGTATFTFTENSAAALTGVSSATPGTLTVNITPFAGGPGTVVFVGTPTIAAPGSLGATVAGGGGTSSFTITIRGHDDLNVETIVIGGLKIQASADANPGAMVATLGVAAGNVNAAFTANTTVTGTLVSPVGSGVSAGVQISAVTGCGFSTGSAVTFNTNGPDLRTPTFAGPVTSTSNQVVDFPAGAAAHLIGETISQSVACGVSSPGTVATALTYAVPSQLTVFPGESNSPAGNLTISENASTGAAYYVAGKTITATITTAGVTFSAAPVATASLTGVVSTITGNTVAAATVVTTSAAHLLVTGQSVAIAGSNSTPSIDGTFTVTVLTATTFSIPVTVTTAGTSGTVTPTASLSPGWLFSATPTNSNPAVGTLSADRKSVVWTINTASASLDSVVISGIKYDVASTVTGGTAVDVTVAYSGGNVQPTSRSNAIVARGVTATSTAPTVYIGENGQTGGTISIVENLAGTFTDGTGSFNTFQVCLTTGETFAAAPSATVSVGNLQLRSGATFVAPGTAVVGTPFTTLTGNPNCYYWTVWAASTTASTIAIGPLMLNVGSTLSVGPTNAAVGIGSVASFSVDTAIIVKVANRVFRNQVVVTALSQPTIPVGSNGSHAGNIQIQETAPGQLKAGEIVCVEIVPNQNVNILYDAFFKGLNTAAVPVVEATNGLVVGAVSFGANGEDCFGIIHVQPTTLPVSFHFTIAQQSVGANGKLVISGIQFVTVNDAVAGPIQVHVYGLGGTPTNVQFQSVVSNARIGGGQVDAWIAKGNNVRDDSAFSLNTAIVKQNTRVTLRFASADASAGTLVEIWVKTKTTAWKIETHRRITGDGFAYYSPKVLNKGYRYYRVVVNGNLSNTVRAFGK